MKYLIKTLVTLTLITFACVSESADYGQDSGWYLTPNINYILSDDLRDADDSLGLQFGVGKTMFDRWALELYGVTNTLQSNNSSNEYSQSGFGLDLFLYLNPEEDISFYGVGGAGNLSTDFAGFSESVPMANIGAGVRGRFSGKSLFWRVDARYRIDEYNGFPPEERLRDWVINVGLLIPLGKKDETISTIEKKVVPAQNPFDSDNDGVANDIDKCADTLAGVQVNVLGCEYDTDRDGVVDSQDKCAGTPLYVKVDSKGCDFYDLDKDGIEDDKDKCPETPSGIKVNELGCELDSDKDWVVDSQDECPETAPGIEVGANGCERDTDQDGIVDSQDKCPDTKPGQAVNNTGCELPSVPDVIVLEGVSFKYNSAELSSGSSAVLNKAVETLKSQTNLMIEVAGHSDSVGNPEYNRHLSYLRAVAVMDYLVEHGVPSLNLSAKGYGDKSPIASNESSEGRAKNRRVELRIIGQQ